MGALMLVLLLAALDQTIVSTALPQIATKLGGLDHLSWVATAYLLTSAITTPIYGKISDLFGRKKIFQIAIIIFLVGSICAGLAQSMNQLILARGLQGLGAGGLMSLVLAIVGDIVPPRQRGQYAGYFGAVFGLSSVIGPLLGGFLTEQWSWRWVFFINIPLGIIALAAVASRLHLPVHRREHKIDYVGAGLLSAGSVSLLLATVWGGSMYAWNSPEIIGLLVGGVLLGVTFVLWERKAPEPIIPMKLFRNDIFTVSTILSLLAGIAMFASILYIPMYQQIVRGNSPTESGLLMIPLVAGIFTTSITSGKLITKFGKYKLFPIIGTLTLALGLWMFSHVQIDTAEWLLGTWMFVIGAGLGCFMQVMTLAIQNSVDRRDLGTATSSATFFRSLGSAFGGAIFGSILNNRLTHHFHDLIPSNVAGGLGSIDISSVQNGSALHTMSPEVSRLVLEAFVRSFQDMFLIAIPIALLAFVVALFLRETPLKSGHDDPNEDMLPVE